MRVLSRIRLDDKPNLIVLPVLQSLIYRKGQLVCTGSAASAAVIAPEQRSDFFRFRAFHQFADGLQIPRAAARKFYIVQPAFRIHFKINLAGADPIG